MKKIKSWKNEGTIEFAKLQLELLNKLDNLVIDRQEAQFAVERFWVGALKDAAVDGKIAKGSLMAGQSVGILQNYSKKFLYYKAKTLIEPEGLTYYLRIPQYSRSGILFCFYPEIDT